MTRRTKTSFKTALPALTVALACVFMHAATVAADETPNNAAKPAFDPTGCVRPVWPQGALEAKHSGTVTLALLVGEDGSIQQSKVTKSSGHEDLDEAARTSIAKCKFVPGKLRGKPQEAWLQMQYVWTLD